MDFNSFMSQAWADHATDAAAVAGRLNDGATLVADESHLTRLMDLAHHVHGGHLGHWQEGAAFIAALADLPSFVAEGSSGLAQRRCLASLALSGGADDALGALSPSDRIRVIAMASTNLAERDTQRGMRLLQEAIDEARRADLPPSDPVNRALAIAGNGMACTLEEKPARSAQERELMILAAQAARHYWAIAGTWLETERAEYRLAMTWLQAGDLPRARTHAQACLEIVAANEGAALERLFGWEALGRVERAAGNAVGHAQALARAREAFADLSESDKAWCAASVEALAS